MASLEVVADPTPPRAGTASPLKKKRGRHRGSLAASRTTCKFDVEEGVDLLTDAADKIHPPVALGPKYLPKERKRSNEPHMSSLDENSEVLLQLAKLAPNGYLDPYRLRDLLLALHRLYGIFKPDDTVEGQTSLTTRAPVAADKWRIWFRIARETKLYRKGSLARVTLLSCALCRQIYLVIDRVYLCNNAGSSRQ